MDRFTNKGKSELRKRQIKDENTLHVSQNYNFSIKAHAEYWAALQQPSVCVLNI